MKRMKKVFALLLTMVMVLAMAVPAMAANGASITINNSAKGETYKVYKLFDATVTGTAGGSIAYQGIIPEDLTAYFTKNDATGEITATDAAKDTTNKEVASTALIDALKVWAKNQEEVESAIGTGTALTISGLDYGYYVVTSTQGNGAAITVTSTNPNASINDKNATPPVGDLTKNNDKTGNVNINDTVTYTVEFTTANYKGTDQITSYTIKDTLPDFLDEVTVTSIMIGTTEYKTGNPKATPQFDSNGEITIPWTDEDGTNLYANGAKITVTYTAKVTTSAAIAGAGNTNTVTVSYTTKGNNGGTSEGATDTIYTYALAIKKVNKAGEGLADAVFSLPFSVVANTDGTYTRVVDGTTNATKSVTTPKDGVIVIKGVAAGDYEITETAAPNGYNRLAAPFIATAVKTSETATDTTVYLDAAGNVVGEEFKVTTVTYENKNLAASVVPVLNLTGTELPSTGGIGTTIFYVIGAVCVLGAGVLLVTRRRMSSK